MGRKSRLKKERSRNKKPVTPTSSGYLGMGLVGAILGLLFGIVVGKTYLAWLISPLTGLSFMLILNRLLLYFGFGPRSGATAGVVDTSEYLYGAHGNNTDGCDSSDVSAGSADGSGGGGGGDAD